MDPLWVVFIVVFIVAGSMMITLSMVEGNEEKRAKGWVKQHFD